MKRPTILFLLILALLLMSIVVVKGRCESHNADDTAAADKEAAAVSREEGETYDHEYWLLMDTVLIVDGKALGYMTTDDDMRYHLAYDLKPIIDDPTAELDSVSPTVYAVDLIGRKQRFNIGNASCIDKIKAFNRPIKDFKRYDRRIDMAEDNQHTMAYFFTLDYPDTTVAGCDEISKWLVGLVDGAQIMDVEVRSCVSLYTSYHPTKDYGARYKGCPAELDKLSEYASKMWWASMKAEFAGEYPSTLYFIADFRARILNERYVTYRKYVHSYLGGAHGMYTENLVSYDLVNHRQITNEFLFRDGTTEQVTELLFDVMAHDDHYKSWNEYDQTAENVKTSIEAWNSEDSLGDSGIFRLPQAGLTKEGVVFSFQPYEIECFAAGCFHFVVPYNKIKPYLSKEAVRLLGL